MVGLARNLRLVYSRAGAAGMAELLAARALPRLISYERVILTETPTQGGEHHPELRPRRVRSSDSEVERLHARFAATSEPGVPALSPADLAGRFAAGHELWLFHVEDAPVHGRWVVRSRLRVAGLVVALEARECATEAAATLAGFRRRGVALSARRHLEAALGDEGVVTLLSTVDGFNRRFNHRLLSGGRTRRAAVIHRACCARRRWYRAVPVTSTGAALLARAGLRARRWSPERAGTEGTGAGPWERAAADALARPYLDPQMAHAKRQAHLDLLGRWLPDLRDATVLKTDLWEEGIGGDELLFTLARRARLAYGIDVSPTTLGAASKAAGSMGVSPKLLRADLRGLPLDDGAVDAIVSTSTLDHLATAERPRALAELRRVLSPSGVLVITCDNADNLGDGLLGVAARLGRMPFPLEASMTLVQLQTALVQAGFECRDSAYLVNGPRVVTTALVRLVRLAPRRWSEPWVAGLMGAFDAAGRRAPSRMGAFVAVRAIAG